jgi:hypothetical protein
MNASTPISVQQISYINQIAEGAAGSQQLGVEINSIGRSELAA